MPRNPKQGAAPKRARKSQGTKQGAATSNCAPKPEPDTRVEDWLCRPRVHPAIFEDLPPERHTKSGRLRIAETESQEKAAERLRRREELAKHLNWSNERLASFKQLFGSYRDNPSVANYVRIKHEFPEVEIQVGLFDAGVDAPVALTKEFARRGVDPQLIARAVWDADESSIDALCLRLLELLVAKGQLPKSGPGYIENRRKAISDSIINYLIVVMLEALDWNEEMISVPASLVVLIREQLTGSNPDLHRMCLAEKRSENAAWLAATVAHGSRSFTVRDIAEATGIDKSTVQRLIEAAKAKIEAAKAKGGTSGTG
jgi:hypothetical protein